MSRNLHFMETLECSLNNSKRFSAESIQIGSHNWNSEPLRIGKKGNMNHSSSFAGLAMAMMERAERFSVINGLRESECDKMQTAETKKCAP